MLLYFIRLHSQYNYNLKPVTTFKKQHFKEKEKYMVKKENTTFTFLSEINIKT